VGNTRWALPSAGQAFLARQNRAASAKQTRAQADALLFQTPSDDCRRRAAALQARQLTCRAGARKARNAADAVRQASQAANTRTEGHLSPLRPGPAPITAARQRRVCCPSPKHGAEVRAPRSPVRLREIAVSPHGADPAAPQGVESVFSSIRRQCHCIDRVGRATAPYQSSPARPSGASH
jgi:hypothetical protein